MCVVVLGFILYTQNIIINLINHTWYYFINSQLLCQFIFFTTLFEHQVNSTIYNYIIYILISIQVYLLQTLQRENNAA